MPDPLRTPPQGGGKGEGVFGFASSRACLLLTPLAVKPHFDEFSDIGGLTDVPKVTGVGVPAPTL
jgi:hypothetical protein